MTVYFPMFQVASTFWLCLLIGTTHNVFAQSQTDARTTTNSAANRFLSNYCSDCHTGEFAEGEFIFSESLPIEWNQPKKVEHWEQVHMMVSRKLMPYPDSEQPTEAERAQFLSWLDNKLMQHGRLGGTVLRRLSRREYANTIRTVFGFQKFEVSDDFPPDSTYQGFDNHGHSLFTAPSHLDALVTNAVAVADRIYPPQTTAHKPTTTSLRADDLVISYSSAFPIDGTMRLASSGSNYVRNATWPSRFEAPIKGVYQVRVKAEAINPKQGHLPEIRLGTMRNNISVDEEAGLKSFLAEGIQDVDFEVTLDEGQTISLLYANGAFNYDDKQALAAFLTTFFARQPKIAAAWDRIGQPARGGSGWKQIQQEIQKGDLPVEDYVAGSAKFEKLVKRLSGTRVNTGETLVYHFFQEGPAIAIHEVVIDGPIKTLPSASQTRQQQDREKWLQQLTQAAGSPTVKARMRILLTKLFRRPATDDEVNRYSRLVRQETARTTSDSEGWHLALRTALISPSFLYRTVGRETQMSQQHLASQLAYFLTSGPPDDTLMSLANSNRISNPKILKQQVRRLINDDFVEDFSRQWLHLSALDSLMPDARLIANFTERHRESMLLEVTKTFRHVLNKNLPVTDLIAPDFVFTNSILATDIYQLDEFQNKRQSSKASSWAKVSVDRTGRHGGLICMAAVTTATANGVDTQPVLRGVWMLENILGTPPPEPPDAVPALTPDTSAAVTVKERLAAHMSEDTCASCHAEIDPIGFVLENFDPVGRWRSHYPVYQTIQKGKRQKVVRKDGLMVDAAGVLPDGTPLSSISDLKSWLLKHPEHFACCISEKLMTYATGRKLSYRERSIIRKIVLKQIEAADGQQLPFKNLLIDLVASEVFLTP
ncbi:MAG: DUF1588 domain-containing protein [Fuerstiella sp.]